MDNIFWKDIFTAIWPPLAILISGVLGSVLLYKGTNQGNRNVAKKDDRSADNEEFKNAVNIWDQLDERIEKEVQKRIEPYENRLSVVETDLKDLTDSFKAYVTQIWVWNYRGRQGEMPRLPQLILHKLGLGHLVDSDDIEDTIEVPTKGPP